MQSRSKTNGDDGKTADAIQQQHDDEATWQFIRPPNPMIDDRSLLLAPSIDDEDHDDTSSDSRVFSMTGCHKVEEDDKFYVSFQFCQKDDDQYCDHYRLQEVDFVNVVAGFAGIEQSEDQCGPKSSYCKQCLPNYSNYSSVELFECEEKSVECPAPYSQTVFNYYDSNEDEPYLYELGCDGRGGLVLKGHREHNLWTFVGWVESCDYKNEVGAHLFGLATTSFSCWDEEVASKRPGYCPGLCELLTNVAQTETVELPQLQSASDPSPPPTARAHAAQTETVELAQVQSAGDPSSSPTGLATFSVVVALSFTIGGFVVWRRNRRRSVSAKHQTHYDSSYDYELVEVKGVEVSAET